MEEVIQEIIDAIVGHSLKQFNCPVRVMESVLFDLWDDPNQAMAKCGIRVDLSENLLKEIKEKLEEEINDAAKNCEMGCYDCPAN
ncbi:MAG: hypothetical protein QW540_09055 [Archaeoglobaceae archaeon]